MKRSRWVWCAVAASGVAALLHMASGCAGPEKWHRQLFGYVVPTEGAVGIVVDAPEGDIIVRGVPDIDSVYVSGTHLVLARNEDDAAFMFNQVILEIDHERGWITISHGEPLDGTRDYRVNFVLTIPKALHVKARAAKGRIDVRRVAAIAAATVDGPISISRTHSANARSTNGPVEIDSTSGNISVDVVNGPLSITYGRPIATTDIRTVNGPVSLALPDSPDAYVDVATVNGPIDATAVGLGSASGGVASTLRGTLGEGGPVIRVATVNGPVVMDRR